MHTTLLDSAILSGHSEKTHLKEVWNLADFLMQAAVAYDLLPEITVGILASANCLASRKEIYFSARMHWISFSFYRTRQSWADEVWGPLPMNFTKQFMVYMGTDYFTVTKSRSKMAAEWESLGVCVYRSTLKNKFKKSLTCAQFK